MSFPARESVKSFVTEKEIEEKKKVRQSEWEKVRKPEQPLQCPEEPIDNRTLYDRLRDQKLKEQEEKDEAKKMKNFVRGLEHDEVEFLDQLDDIYTRMEREKKAEERKALEEFREKMGSVSSEAVSLDNTSPAVSGGTKRKEPLTFGFDQPAPKKSQKDLLASAVRLKRTTSSDSPAGDTVPSSTAPKTTSSENQSERLPSATEKAITGKTLPSAAFSGAPSKLLVAYESDSD